MTATWIWLVVNVNNHSEKHTKLFVWSYDTNYYHVIMEYDEKSKKKNISSKYVL